MNQTDVRRWVNVLVANGLRKEAPLLTSGKIGARANQKDVTKVRTEMLKLAEKLHPTKSQTEERKREPEAGPPGPKRGPDDISQDPDAAEEGAAHPAAG